MKRFKNHLIVTAIFALLTTIGTIMNSRQAVAQNPNPRTAPVTVQNTSANPVPVTGSVGLANGASVQVNNSATSPVLVRNVDDPARHAFQIQLCASLGAPCAPTVPGSFTVPSSQHLVVRYVSGTCTANATYASLGLATFAGGTPVSNTIPIPGLAHTLPIAQPTGLYDIGRELYISADPGSAVNLLLTVTGGVTLTCTVSLSGYTVGV